ncbi:MAG TPA: hypothetical protein VFB12_25420 [Ktedonobacteraceae bacterium]|nr:hypothetical protein [Ktedonobacteraceae bacterium]
MDRRESPHTSNYTTRIALEKRRAVAQKVANTLDNYPAISAVLACGSVALGYVDERSDVDMYVICRSAVPPLAELLNRHSQIGSDWRMNQGSATNPIFGDIWIEGLVDSISVTLHYQTVPWMAEVIQGVLENGAITTEKVPFRPYTLLGLLQRAWILRDYDRTVAHWRAQMRNYPRQLKLNLFDHFVPILIENTEDLVATAERKLGPIGILFHLFMATDGLNSLLFALNETYDPADRRAWKVILPTLPLLPHKYIARLTGILEGPFDEVNAIYKTHQFQQLANEVVQMIRDAQRMET